jgi:alkylation response protein AidB-like acyl-CoA dehydrogenase
MPKFVALGCRCCAKEKLFSCGYFWKMNVSLGVAARGVGAEESSPDYEALAAQFRPIFDRIAKGAVQREANRELAYAEIGWLRDAGFGKVRIPRYHGGLGATLPQFFRLLTELAAADSNIAHAFRGHFSFLEERINKSDEASINFWFPKVVLGKIIGYAMAERTEETGSSTVLTPDGENWCLNGVKFYSTGTIYADWIVVAAKDGDDFLSVAVPADADGVTRIDDWDGFGQRLTGSGTTKFENVAIAQHQVIRRFTPDDTREDSYNLSFLQMVLLSTLAGVGRAALRDVVAFVQPRTRAFGIPGQSSPRNDPLVQRIVGRVASLSFAADSLIENNARLLEDLYQARLSGTAKAEDYVIANVRTFQAQQMVIDLILQETTLLFEVGGASATSVSRQLDRHWRNARTAASHNPAIFRERAIGDFLLNGTAPATRWALQKQILEEGQTTVNGTAKTGSRETEEPAL